MNWYKKSQIEQEPRKPIFNYRDMQTIDNLLAIQRYEEKKGKPWPGKVKKEYLPMFDVIDTGDSTYHPNSTITFSRPDFEEGIVSPDQIQNYDQFLQAQQDVESKGFILSSGSR